MEKLRRVGLILLGLILGGGLLFIVIDLFKPKVAGLFVETNPSAKVLVDGVQMGMTPYRTTTKPGEVIILLIPESFNVSLATYETKVTLIPGVETVIRREFRELDDVSAGEIVSFDKINKDETSLAVVTDPDSAQLTIDGIDRAYTPHKTSSILPGEHTLDISADGYLDRVVRVKTHRGYKLTAFVKLGKTSMNPQESSPTTIPTPEPTSSYERKVEILQTDTGFLRVRENPSTLGKEIRQVRPGESYSLLDIDGKTGWFKIELEDGTVGWISNQYAREIESVSPTPTPAP
ncbi:hypothetical protein A2715_03705 [Candidatus Woesebacteria bacterium RIFCSPHIGHO2_01_FULL_39_32]|nr:MAG: hypothetical protein A2715_03705 [Candidatus Woesebacteria bacterium RIFCSPHIGHO2_01_FULL_39_32]OGM37166.1 MAG: hypothetical protein A3F01_05645 [Candidatus Woesebacteria bacterium RIFCSPHIGHO2_12_FULL_38_11]OGM64671.1 MAG: hypothetical protein A2893_06620 [Candidatus Woesebacteria bacterium RIFCSPLOWO2_01_FULL_39_25]